MRPLKIKLSRSYKKALINYEEYKLTKDEVLHFLLVIDTIVEQLKKIQVEQNIFLKRFNTEIPKTYNVLL